MSCRFKNLLFPDWLVTESYLIRAYGLIQIDVTVHPETYAVVRPLRYCLATARINRSLPLVAVCI